MAFAVVLYFDTSTEEKILKFQQYLLDVDIASSKINTALRPHITLGIYENIMCAECESKINEIACNLKLRTIDITSVGIFLKPEKVIFLSPVPSLPLIQTHQSVHQVLDVHTSGSWEIYEPGKWVPHCTLANDLELEDLKKAIPLYSEFALPIKADISQIGIVEFDPNKPVLEVDIS